MSTNDQVVLVMAAAALLLAAAHMLKDNPKAPILAGAVILVALIPVVNRLIFR